jgi:polysaccharide pyruvyl transferase WcaK-like protein
VKIAIIGSALAGNKGAAAMLESAVAHLSERNPGAEITLLSMYPRSDAERNTHPNVRVLNASPLRLGIGINGAALLWRILPPLRGPIGRAMPEVGALAAADVLLDQGGITFVDGRGKYLVYNIASILPAIFTKTPVVKCAQALGPFRSRTNRFSARRMLPKMAAIVSRGAVTHEHLVGLGLTNIEEGADLAFTLDVTPEDAAGAKRLVDIDFFGAGDVVGVSPSQVLRKSTDAAGGDYVADVVAQIDFITEEMGRPVFLVPHSVRMSDDKLHNNDLPVCRAIYAKVASPDRVLFPDKELTSQELRYLIGKCDLFVASRFHAMVSSLAMGVPTFVIGWSHKYREVLDMFDLASWALAHEAVTPDVFRERMLELDSSKAKVRKQLAAGAPKVRAVAMRQLDTIERVAKERAAKRAAKKKR